jgi:hypothetical protein
MCVTKVTPDSRGYLMTQITTFLSGLGVLALFIYTGYGAAL